MAKIIKVFLSIKSLKEVSDGAIYFLSQINNKIRQLK